MFKVYTDEDQCSFSVERTDVRFGEGTRVVFWIDMQLKMLQRGRQEYIPLTSIQRFFVAPDRVALLADMGADSMELFADETADREKLQVAADQLNAFVGNKA